MRYLLSLFVVLLSLPTLHSQPGKLYTMDEKAIKYYKEGIQQYEARQNEKAIQEFEKALKRDPNFFEALSLTGSIYIEMRNMEKALEYLGKAVAVSPTYHPNTTYRLGILELGSGRYADSKKHLEQFLAITHVNPAYREVAEQSLLSCTFAIEAMKKPVAFNPINMGPEINTQFDEYFPTVTADGQTFFVTRLLPAGTVNGRPNYQEDFFFSNRGADGKWAPARALPFPINSENNEGAPSISADGRMLFFAACDEYGGGYSANREGFGSCDIFVTFKSGQKWSKVFNVGAPVNSSRWETQPSFSSDGKTLYYIKGFKNAEGENHGDIYVTRLQPDGSWSKPLPLGNKINTPQDEASVFIHPDNQTLYFSSDGHPGMGGLDLYMCKRQPGGDWGDPINLGYPINTHNDENSLLVGPDGKIAYFASDRKGGFGGLDMYHFELPAELRAEKLTYMKGRVFDSKTKKPLEAEFELIDRESSKAFINSTSDATTGEFLVCLPGNKNYALNVSKAGYAFHSEDFSLKNVEADFTKPFRIDVYLDPADTGTIVKLKNVFFDTDKSDLKPESKAELDKLKDYLVLNKTMKIQLSGHTDNVGLKDHNKKLSESRAKAVYDYLITNGIVKERLSYKGYGDTKPEVANDTPENRQINRRTEFKIMSK